MYAGGMEVYGGHANKGCLFAPLPHTPYIHTFLNGPQARSARCQELRTQKQAYNSKTNTTNYQRHYGHVPQLGLLHPLQETVLTQGMDCVDPLRVNQQQPTAALTCLTRLVDPAREM